jgi:catechol 2,3-dioxygenase-like lactoylglutathione lyase family enzyme
VADIDAFVTEMRSKGMKIDDPEDSHLGMRAVSFEDPDGYRIEIQMPTEKSPEWLQRMIE